MEATCKMIDIMKRELEYKKVEVTNIQTEQKAKDKEIHNLKDQISEVTTIEHNVIMRKQNSIFTDYEL